MLPAACSRLPKNLRLILASASPRRRQLLRHWRVPHRVVPSHIHEPPPGRTPPIRYARRLALAKAQAVVQILSAGKSSAVRASAARALYPPTPYPQTPYPPTLHQPTPCWVLGADTIVVAGRRILGKPKSLADAERMLRRLSGTTHRVITAVALVNAASGRTRIAHAVSRVTMRRLSDPELRRYARRHLDKAGAYAVQDTDDPVVTKIVGSYTNVVGLPKETVQQLLKWAGIRVTAVN